MRAIIDRILQRLITRGLLRVRYPDGKMVEYVGGGPGPTAGLEICDMRMMRGLLLNPVIALGEGYMDGRLRTLDCTLYDLIDALLLNLDSGGRHPVASLREVAATAMKRLLQFNPAARAKRNVAHHYDLNGRLYSLLLDRDRQYSCGYFPRGDETLDEAQAAKKAHIAAKLLLDRPGLEVLDIGCGWGGMALTLARDYGARVTGITLSVEQLEAARQRAKQENFDDLVRFELMDYRHLDRTFDRIVSVGMFEHVGVGHYPQFFRVIQRALRPQGVALVHAIGRASGPGSTNPWLSKYIFPGGYSPALSEVLPAVERSGLWATDIEILRLHYAETIRHWRRNFTAKRDAIAALYDERFCRMFELYLASCEITFRRRNLMVFQIQLAAEVDTVPLTRDYIRDAETQLRRQHAETPLA